MAAALLRLWQPRGSVPALTAARSYCSGPPLKRLTVVRHPPPAIAHRPMAGSASSI